MGTKAIDIARHYHKNYLLKAEECGVMMHAAVEKGIYNAAVILAVHCGISAADALTVRALGVRHVGDSHLDVINSLEKLDCPGVRKRIRQFRSVIGLKNIAEYREKLMTSEQAQKAVQQAERFLSWARLQISG